MPNIFSIQPSPALVVLADTSLRDCLNIMKSKTVGSVLILETSAPHKLIGIFTERDLLMKHEDLLNQKNWDEPIAMFMKRGVKTLSILNLDQAPSVMLEGGFRHLPIVYQDESGNEKISGVISIRDLLKNLAQQLGKSNILHPLNTSNKKEFKKTVCFFEKADSKNLFTWLQKQTPRSQFIQKSLSEITDQPSNLELILKDSSLMIVDLDGQPPAKWAQFLSTVLTRSDTPALIILFNPSLHRPVDVDALKGLSRQIYLKNKNHDEKLRVYTKPLNYLQLIASIGSLSQTASR